MSEIIEVPVIEKLTSKDFVPAQDVKWCPGCGDYSVLKQVHTIFPELGVKKEDFVFVCGIGCSSRFTFYVDSYGMHSIHGRATAIASGIKASRPELSVWVVTGDGDALSIGGNHFIHILRKNFDINILLFNNQIYGLTKGQYSPTSETGKITKSSPYGSVEQPFNPAELALGAKATFVSRTLDRDPKHMQAILKKAYYHKGASFVEIYQNCPVFNDGAFFIFTDKETKKTESLFLEDGKPLVFGVNNDKGIKLDGFNPVVVDLNENGNSINDLWIHHEKDRIKANILAGFQDMKETHPDLPRPFGVLYAVDKPTYEDAMAEQIARVVSKKGKPSLDTILSGEKTWVIG
ncbi:MAG: 2-oxoacid:ferredoxin oxidoreductase subunit beta [Ignavibacteria bacterium]|jgi:2-oxoglutarate ferredoxin oxidoreductase subunit beta|nr:2-oxoacid:ferredoxin oxidoreductase subunit beta [Ignavibacteria bacterium]